MLEVGLTAHSTTENTRARTMATMILVELDESEDAWPCGSPLLGSLELSWKAWSEAELGGESLN